MAKRNVDERKYYEDKINHLPPIMRFIAPIILEKTLRTLCSSAVKIRRIINKGCNFMLTLRGFVKDKYFPRDIGRGKKQNVEYTKKVPGAGEFFKEKCANRFKLCID